ncbi:MAG: hypothetical protein A2218_06790 [Elusimicrobia bacterium RIFOXYA2_FULL_53_38]|nr:MAG: hypothetical protein A2218_06790 [Elusimicrobia bacterium RIFOXYA2_FULL_53_38]
MKNTIATLKSYYALIIYAVAAMTFLMPPVLASDAAFETQLANIAPGLFSGELDLSGVPSVTPPCMAEGAAQSARGGLLNKKVKVSMEKLNERVKRYFQKYPQGSIRIDDPDARVISSDGASLIVSNIIVVFNDHPTPYKSAFYFIPGLSGRNKLSLKIAKAEFTPGGLAGLASTWGLADENSALEKVATDFLMGFMSSVMGNDTPSATYNNASQTMIMDLSGLLGGYGSLVRIRKIELTKEEIVVTAGI